MTRKRHTTHAEIAALKATLGESPVGEDGAPVYDRPSKSQRKRDMTALQVLGKALAELPKEAFRKVPLPEDLFDALTETRRITDHEGRRRQLQYVGKVMRRLDDGEVAALQQTLDKIRGVSRAETVRMHAMERWRDLLLEGDGALTDFMHRYPQADVQQGRTLIRNARRERSQPQGSPRYYRELFQWVKAASEAARQAESPDGDAALDDDEIDDHADHADGHRFAGRNDGDDEDDDSGDDDDFDADAEEHDESDESDKSDDSEDHSDAVDPGKNEPDEQPVKPRRRR